MNISAIFDFWAVGSRETRMDFREITKNYMDVRGPALVESSELDLRRKYESQDCTSIVVDRLLHFDVNNINRTGELR